MRTLLIVAGALIAVCGCAADAKHGDAGASGSAASFGAAGAGAAGNAGAAGATDAGGSNASGSAGNAGLRDGSAPQHDARVQVIDGGTTGDAGRAFTTGVNVHNYPKPTAYGYVAADGADRMGDGLTQLSVRYVRGPTIGDVAFLARLAGFGVTHVILGLDAKSYGKPFDAQRLATALDLSLAEAKRLGLQVTVEGLNEWDLFNSKTYNAGVLPTGVDASAFVALTQKALYDAAHPRGVLVLGPSVGHSQDPKNLGFFPDVAAYVDIVNLHLYFGQMPEVLMVAQVVASHEAFQGAGKPVWITETGISAYGGVSAQQQADVITRGLSHFAASGVIDAAFVYQLIDQSKPGLQGGTFTPDSAEYYFGLFDYDGVKKPAADAVKQAIANL